jgi:YfiH family protein
MHNAIVHCGTAYETADDIAQLLTLKALVLLDQTHGIKGHVITEYNYHMPALSAEGDFLVTNISNVGLGVLTADCLPIIFVDTYNNAVGIAHAGWRGSVNNIAAQTLHCMQKNYGTVAADVSIIFGPSAHVCCYQIQSDFLAHLAPFQFGTHAIVHRNNNLFFNSPYFNEQILLSLGVRKDAINYEHSVCTICNEDYFSYRRQGIAAGRQVSVISIK